jgi:hypothetical protein
MVSSFQSDHTVDASIRRLQQNVWVVAKPPASPNRSSTTQTLALERGRAMSGWSPEGAVE